MNFIEPTNIYSTMAEMRSSVNTIISSVGWADKNQIGLTRRNGVDDIWFDSTGSLYDRKTMTFTRKESDFTIWNPVPEFLKQEILKLGVTTNTKFGRIRIMRLLPHRGLSVHYDNETRYHYVIETNPKSYICLTDPEAPRDRIEVCAQCYHLPSDGQWYHVDTRRVHWVYNGGETERIHIVVCALE